MKLIRRAIRIFTVAACLAAPLVAADESPTVIASDTGEMVSSETESTFTFRNNVVVTGTNIKITCDLLVVIANRTGDPKATLGKQDKFKSLVATGHVRILQNDREAVCERAEVFPGEDKVVLSGNPKVRTLDGQYVADGPVIELYRGQRRAIIKGGTRIALPPLKDLGYGKESGKTPAKPAPEQSTPESTPPQK